MARREFPTTGFLTLGVLSLLAALVFVARAIGVELTAERIWSAIVFGAIGVFWLVAFWSSRHTSGN